MIGVVINGVNGRMGQMVAAEVEVAPDLNLVAGLTRQSSAAVFDDLGSHWDVIIDFSTPDGTRAALHAARAHNKALVSGVTGLPDDLLSEIDSATSEIPIVLTSNFSVAVAAILDLLPRLVRALPDADIELVEMHHRHKRDAPSGTAESMLRAITSARQQETSIRFGREGMTVRTGPEIGVHSLRGGGNPGEHTVIFAGPGEEIRISHRALSRTCFATGAVQAARWVMGQPPGRYGMADVTSGSMSTVL